VQSTSHHLHHFLLPVHFCEEVVQLVAAKRGELALAVGGKWQVLFVAAMLGKEMSLICVPIQVCKKPNGCAAGNWSQQQLKV